MSIVSIRKFAPLTFALLVLSLASFMYLSPQFVSAQEPTDSQIRQALCGGYAAGSQSYATCFTEADDQIDACGENVQCREDLIDNQSPRSTSGSINPAASDCSEDTRRNANEDALHPDNCGITRYIQIFTNALSVIVGVTIIAMLVVAGIRYASAGANPQAVSSAKQHISNALLALVIYIFMFAFLQWIIPGGVL